MNAGRPPLHGDPSPSSPSAPDRRAQAAASGLLGQRVPAPGHRRFPPPRPAGGPPGVGVGGCGRSSEGPGPDAWSPRQRQWAGVRGSRRGPSGVCLLSPPHRPSCRSCCRQAGGRGPGPSQQAGPSEAPSTSGHRGMGGPLGVSRWRAPRRFGWEMGKWEGGVVGGCGPGGCVGGRMGG